MAFDGCSIPRIHVYLTSHALTELILITMFKSLYCHPSVI
jgi:hypothetical protein